MNGALLESSIEIPFKLEKQERAKQPLELVYIDICGLVEVEFFKHKRYILTFGDDFSRKTWVYFLREKSEAFAKFKEFKTLIEKQSSFYVRTLWFNRGGAFTSNEFFNFCKNQGIQC